MHYLLIFHFSLNKWRTGLSTDNSIAATDSINSFFLAVSPFLGFMGVAFAFNGFVGHMWVNCITILTNNAMIEEPWAEPYDITHEVDK